MALEIKGKLNTLIQLGGTPLSFYKVEIHGVNIEEHETTLCKGVCFPGSKRNTVDFFYGGVKYPIPREHQHAQTVELTFYQDDKDSLRSKFLDWLKSGDNANATSVNIVQYRDKSMKQESVVTQYELKNAFATDVSDIKLAYDKAAELGEFTVTLAYSVMKEK